MSKQRDDLAKEIYLKRLPNTPITEQSKRSFESAAEQAYEMADVFIYEAEKQHEADERAAEAEYQAGLAALVPSETT